MVIRNAEGGKEVWNYPYTEPDRYDRFKHGVKEILGDRSSIDVLDIGAYTGEAIDGMAQSFREGGPEFDVYTLDVDRSSLDRSRDRGHEAVGAWSGELPYVDDAFDLVVSRNVFPHLDLRTQSKSLREVERVLSPDGAAAVQIRMERNNFLSMDYVFPAPKLQEMRDETENFESYPFEWRPESSAISYRE